METLHRLGDKRQWIEFLPYLWGMETFPKYTVYLRYHSSYRTYEEWKPETVQSILAQMQVLTVPMRNGNTLLPNKIKIPLEFLPYLWGMETWLEWWYTCLCFCVLTVPMRNGNYAGTVTSMHIFDCSYRTYEEWKHFLPINHYNQVKCSYRTYEEWKRVEDWVSQEDVDGSYRTYEEWKRLCLINRSKSERSSYRTYEEWKH